MSVAIPREQIETLKAQATMAERGATRFSVRLGVTGGCLVSFRQPCKTFLAGGGRSQGYEEDCGNAPGTRRVPLVQRLRELTMRTPMRDAVSRQPTSSTAG
jgi:hypothetical protein